MSTNDPYSPQNPVPPTTTTTTTSGPAAATTHSAATGHTATETRRPRMGDYSDPRVAGPRGYQPTTSGDYWADRYNMDVLERLRPFGQILLLAGLIIMLLARGWDTVGDRNAAAANLRVQEEMNEWQGEYEEEINELRQEERDLQNQENFDANDQDRLNEVRQEIRGLERQRSRDEERQRDRWGEMQRDARETQAENQLAKPYREGLFVFGTTLFALGLLGVGFTTEGPARWFCLALLAIIVFSMFFGSGATSSAISNVRSATSGSNF